MEVPNSNTIVTVPPTQEGDLVNLTHAIVEWRRIVEEIADYRLQIRERNKKVKALEEVILRVMKNNNIGALDLKNSSSRILFKRQKRQTGLGPKNLQKYLTEYLKSETKAAEALKFINEHREVVTRESLALEKM
jgi:hypothetical protein